MDSGMLAATGLVTHSSAMEGGMTRGAVRKKG